MVAKDRCLFGALFPGLVTKCGIFVCIISCPWSNSLKLQSIFVFYRIILLKVLITGLLKMPYAKTELCAEEPCD